MEFENHHEEQEAPALHPHELGLQPPNYNNDSVSVQPNSSTFNKMNINNNNTTTKMEEDEEEEEESPSPIATVPSPTIAISNKKSSTSGSSGLIRARYKECLKNHAVGIGGQAVDGCGEFMAAGPEGSLDALKCAACNCHRNFHRKEYLEVLPTRSTNTTNTTSLTPQQQQASAAVIYQYPLLVSPPQGQQQQHYNHHTPTASSVHHQNPPATHSHFYQFYPPNRTGNVATPPGAATGTGGYHHHQHHVSGGRPPLALPSTSGGGGARSTEGEEEEDVSNHDTPVGMGPGGVIIGSGSGGTGGTGGGYVMVGSTTSSCSKKRFRTKFSQEQKEKMLEFAEQIGWRIQKQDEGAIQNFCNETGVKRQVLKVWMHNNKHTLGKKKTLN